MNELSKVKEARHHVIGRNHTDQQRIAELDEREAKLSAEEIIKELREALIGVMVTHDYHTDDGKEAAERASKALAVSKGVK